MPGKAAARAVPAGHADDLTAGTTRDRYVPALDRVAGRDRHPVRGPDVPERRHPRGLSQPDVPRGPERGTSLGLSGLTAAESQVDVEVDQTGQEDAAAEIDLAAVDLTTEGAPGEDVGDAAVLDDDREVTCGARPVPSNKRAPRRIRRSIASGLRRSFVARGSCAATLAKVSDPSDLVEEAADHGVEHITEPAGCDAWLRGRRRWLSFRSEQSRGRTWTSRTLRPPRHQRVGRKEWLSLEESDRIPSGEPRLIRRIGQRMLPAGKAPPGVVHRLGRLTLLRGGAPSGRRRRSPAPRCGAG
jgi:hypothetical protein